MEKMGSPAKIYGASFAGAYGTEGTKLAVNAQLELPINQEVSDSFTVGFLSLNEHFFSFSYLTVGCIVVVMY